MKYDVKMSCGHMVTIQLFGKGEERERKVKWLEENGLCQKCQLDAEKKLARSKNLSELIGTVKQINWALRIRNRLIQDFEAIGNPKDSGYERFMEWFKNHTDARFWIDHEDCMPRQIVREFLDEEKKKG